MEYRKQMDIDLAEDSRQRAADLIAIMLLTELNMREVPPDLSRLASMVAAACTMESPETLQRYSAMDWQKAVREIKIAFAKRYLAGQPIGPDEALPPSVDEQIGQCLVAALFKFITFRSLNPDWYAPHLEQTRLAGAPLSGE